MEPLTKAVQRLDRRLEQLDSREHEAGRSAVNYERTGPIEGGLRQGPGEWAQTGRIMRATGVVLIVAVNAILLEIAIRLGLRGIRGSRKRS